MSAATMSPEKLSWSVPVKGCCRWAGGKKAELASGEDVQLGFGVGSFWFWGSLGFFWLVFGFLCWWFCSCLGLLFVFFFSEAGFFMSKKPPPITFHECRKMLQGFNAIGSANCQS